jgi:predicted HicB family RNase H-like nuclease
MSTMTYKSYTARIDYDDRDGIFVGRVLGVRDNIGFHGATVRELTADFHAAVDHYLAVCAKRGESPQKPYSGKLLLRVPAEVHAAAAIAAEATGASLNQWAARVIRDAAAAKGPR